MTRLFHLQRDHDVTGVSGTGRVADGVLWPDGSVALRWRGDRPSTVHWDRIADAEQIHGHNGATRIVWADQQPDDAAKVLAKRDGAVLRQAAADLMAACPEHGDADEVWMDCPCEYAEELVRKAVLAEAGSTP